MYATGWISTIACRRAYARIRHTLSPATADIYATMTSVLIMDAIAALLLVALPISIFVYALIADRVWGVYAFKCLMLIADIYPALSNVIAIVFVKCYKKALVSLLCTHKLSTQITPSLAHSAQVHAK